VPDYIQTRRIHPPASTGIGDVLRMLARLKGTGRGVLAFLASLPWCVGDGLFTFLNEGSSTRLSWPATTGSCSIALVFAAIMLVQSVASTR